MFPVVKAERKTALVTGGAGFIGSHIVDLLVQEGYRVVVYDNFSMGKRENVNPEAVVVKGNIRNGRRVNHTFERYKPDVVFHLAAQAGVPTSMKDPLLDASTNLIGTLNILEASKKAGVQKIIYSSTAASYGEIYDQDLPLREDQPIRMPTSFYGISKRAAEDAIKVFCQREGMDYIALRYANVYGPRQNPKAEYGVVAKFIDAFLRNEAPVIFGDGSHVRDYIFVEDVAKANIAAMHSPIRAGVFNISSQSETSNLDIFNLIAPYFNPQAQPIFKPDRPGDPKKSILSNQRAQQELGWKPSVSLEDGIRQTVDFYRRRTHSK